MAAAKARASIITMEEGAALAVDDSMAAAAPVSST
jgi:hypothetical protein